MRYMSVWYSKRMKFFIDRNPKEKAVKQAFLELAQNGYASIAPDPAEKASEIAHTLKRQAKKLRAAKIPDAPPDDT